MNKIVLVSALMLMSIQINAQDGEMKKLQTIIDEVKSEYAPDKRVALFNIDIQKSESSFKLVGEVSTFYLIKSTNLSFHKTTHHDLCLSSDDF